MNKRGQAALLIAAVVSVVAIIGLVVAKPSSSGAPILGLQSPAYRDVGITGEAQQVGWDLGMSLGRQEYSANQGNRACVTECGPRCETSFEGKAVNDCFQWCKSGCEKAQRDTTMLGGY